MSTSLEKAPIVIDGANVAYAYGSGGQFQLRGILLAVSYFQRLRHPVTVILPPKYRLKCEQDEDETGRVLRQLQSDNILSFAPGGSNDDDFVIQRAVKTGSFILSCDKFEEEKQKHPEWRSYVENYRLNFTFVNGDDFTPNPTPLGPTGPTLKQFLNRRPRPLTSEASVLDAVSKSNQQLLSEIIRVSRRHTADSNGGASSRFRSGRQKSEDLEMDGRNDFVSTNPFHLLSQTDHNDHASATDSCQKSENAAGITQDLKPDSKVPDDNLSNIGSSLRPGSATTNQDKFSTETAPKQLEKTEDQKQKRSTEQSTENVEESPFQQIITGCGTVTQSEEKYGVIRVDENFSTTDCKVVEFYPYACLGSALEGKLLSDKVTMSMIDPVELMNRYPVGTEVGFVAAFIEGFSNDRDTASALQVCARSDLLDGFGHCDYDSIFGDHAFLVSKSGQLHWSPCCDSSLLLFRSAFVEEIKERRLNRLLNSSDWLEYKSMPTPAVALFDTCPIVVKANYMRLTGLIVRLTKDYGIIRSARVNDYITFRNTSHNAENASKEEGNSSKKETRKRALEVGCWVQFRIRKQDAASGGTSKRGLKGGTGWKASHLQVVSKPSCVCGDVEMVECVEKIDNFRQRRKASSSAYAVKLTALGHTGAMKPQQGVLWCQALGRVYIDPAILIEIDLSLYPAGTLVKFDAIHRPHEKSHERKDTVWYATAIHKMTKIEQDQFRNADESSCDGRFYSAEKAVVDTYDSERRWAGLHGRDSHYILYDRYDDVLGRDDGKMKLGETVTVTYVDPPIDSPLYIALAVEPTKDKSVTST